MQLSPLPSRLSVSEFIRAAEGWQIDGEIRQHSPTTRATRKLIIDKFTWWLDYANQECIDTTTLRMFLLYITQAHPEGRWGNPRLTGVPKPATPALYHRHLRAFFNWAVQEEILSSSPMTKISSPIDRADQPQPLTKDQVQALLRAAKTSAVPIRNRAIILFLLDTGMRVSEMCQMCQGDIDLISKSVTVMGKGRKLRKVYFGSTTARALVNYLRSIADLTRDPDLPVWLSSRSDERLTRNAVQHLLSRLGDASHIHALRCSPHTLRHTFAIEFLRNGGNQFTLMELLGHSDLKMTARYLAISQSDAASQHRKFSPADRLSK